jgi:hypothetical protein
LCGFFILGVFLMGFGIYYAALPSEFVKSECSYEAILDSSYSCLTPCSSICRIDCNLCTGQKITFSVSSSQCEYPLDSYSYTSKVCFLSTPLPVGSGTCTLKKDDPCGAESLKDFDDPLDPYSRSSSGDSTNEMLITGISMLVIGFLVILIVITIKFYFIPAFKNEDLEGREAFKNEDLEGREGEEEEEESIH